jgi:hypothetical protein
MAFIKQMFGEGVRVRFRPSYFPFTEPSAEGGYVLRHVRRQRLPGLQPHRLAGDSWAAAWSTEGF